MSNLPLRRRTVATAIAATALGLATPLVRAQTTKIRVSTIPIIDIAPLQVAIAKGYFAAEGIEVDTTPTQGGAAGIPALAAGQVQVVFSNVVSIIQAAKQGLGVQIIAPASTTGDAPPDQAALIAKKSATFKTGKDLEGKRIAVNTRNNIIWLYARAWVRATGGNPDAVTYLEVPFPQMVDAVRGDRVDAAFAVEPFLSGGLATDMQVIGWPYTGVQKRMPAAQYAASKTYIQQNPQVIERWARAYQKGVDWVNQNLKSDELLQIISGYTRIPPAVIARLPIAPYQKTVDPAALDPVVDQMRRNGLLEGAFDPKSILYRTATQVSR
ncbi:MAG: ABC transporter substrate-binding protein [Hydrogenophaga sp.]|nr:ABC transporter substrate-binding protein [Hydrogenophaga sp.]